jgi:hypothetical protein
MLLPPGWSTGLAGLQRHLERDLGEAVDDLVEARIVPDNIISDRVGVLVGDAPVAAERAALVDPGAPPWKPPPSDELRRVIPLTRQHRLLSGDQLVLISLEVWSDWLDLRYAVYASPEPEGELPRPAVIGSARWPTGAGTGQRGAVGPGPVRRDTCWGHHHDDDDGDGPVSMNLARRRPAFAQVDSRCQTMPVRLYGR